MGGKAFCQIRVFFHLNRHRLGGRQGGDMLLVEVGVQVLLEVVELGLQMEGPELSLPVLLCVFD